MNANTINWYKMFKQLEFVYVSHLKVTTDVIKMMLPKEKADHIIRTINHCSDSFHLRQKAFNAREMRRCGFDRIN